MTLLESIVANERQSNHARNKLLIEKHLQNLVEEYPNEVREVLHRTGVPVSSSIPTALLSYIIVKNVDKNPELKDAISKMIIENDGYSSADGTKWQLIGGAVTAVGSVLSGLGRSQTQKEETQNTTAQLEAEHKKELEAQQKRSRRNTIIIVGVSIVVIVGIVLALKMSAPPKKVLTSTLAK